MAKQLQNADEARQSLKEARKTNQHVPAYLLGEKFPPSEQPGSYSPGDENEALTDRCAKKVKFLKL